MHGVTPAPGQRAARARVRLYNRQTTSADVPVVGQRRGTGARRLPVLLSRPTCSVVADHAKRATTTFPAATGPLLRHRLPVRGSTRRERPTPTGSTGTATSPCPRRTCASTATDDFFGGYDHARGAGFVHWADHRIAPGKKQWTWGNDRFGRAWNRNLTDDDGPYIELMAGVYTDNQPDFSFLAPGETKPSPSTGIPSREIGPVQQATTELAVGLWRRGRPAARASGRRGRRPRRVPA